MSKRPPPVVIDFAHDVMTFIVTVSFIAAACAAALAYGG